jgi:predicted O-methyltransferase YrrM
MVDHVVWDNDLSQMAGRHLTALGYGGLVRYTVGEAVEALRKTTGPFDLIFNDIDKQAYPESWEVIKGKLRPGGVLIIDNMFRGGRIFDDNDQSATTEGVREFTRRATTDPDYVVTLAPIRDGLIVAYKK